MHRKQLKEFLYLLFPLFLTLALPQVARAQENSVRESIVKIYVVRDQPDFFNPWSMTGPRASTGSGCVIEGNRILTNAHVVRDQTFVQVRRFGTAKKMVARVLSVSHEADLALLTVEDKSFFEGVSPLRIGKLPRSQQEVFVYGFPLGGDTLSITKGVISRMEHLVYVHSGVSLFAGQIDAAINPGNSGGPVVVGRKIVGVAMQSVAAKSAENIGYMVPVPIIKHYLKDIEDSSYDGFPTMGINWQKLENDDLRLAHGMSADQTGVLVIRTLPGSPSDGTLVPGDVILEIDGNEIGNDGTVEFSRKERTSFQYFIEGRQVGESIQLRILREGEVKDLYLDLSMRIKNRWLVPLHSFDSRPTYFIYGGLVFTPLTKSLLVRWGKNWYDRAPKHLVNKLAFNVPEREGEEVILLLKILAADVTQGYHEYSYWILEEVDGEPVLNMRELAEKLRAPSEKPFVSFTNDIGTKIVLDRKKVQKNEPRILELYRIPQGYSDDLAPTTKKQVSQEPMAE